MPPWKTITGQSDNGVFTYLPKFITDVDCGEIGELHTFLGDSARVPFFFKILRARTSD